MVYKNIIDNFISKEYNNLVEITKKNSNLTNSEEIYDVLGYVFIDLYKQVENINSKGYISLIKAINNNQLLYYITRMIITQAQSSTSLFFRKFRRNDNTDIDSMEIIEDINNLTERRKKEEVEEEFINEILFFINDFDKILINKIYQENIKNDELKYEYKITNHYIYSIQNILKKLGKIIIDNSTKTNMEIIEDLKLFLEKIKKIKTKNLSLINKQIIVYYSHLFLEDTYINNNIHNLSNIEILREKLINLF